MGNGAMANRLCGLVWMLVGCLCALLVGCTAPASGSNTMESNTLEHPPAAPSRDGSEGGSTVRVLQLNLCNSGIAGCYTGRSVARSAAVIRTEIPDLVTLNEICRDDVATLRQALVDVAPGGNVDSAFQAAQDRRTGGEVRCRNGQPYGIGLISRWPAVPGSEAAGGIYPTQDADDPEERAWLCATVAATPAVTACTTHLADGSRTVAAAQCGYLFDPVIAGLRRRAVATPVVLGGDLNLTGDDPGLRSCLPSGWAFADDGAVQHVVASPELVVADSATIDLGDTTDHPGLLVTVVRQASR